MPSISHCHPCRDNDHTLSINHRVLEHPREREMELATSAHGSSQFSLLILHQSAFRAFCGCLAYRVPQKCVSGSVRTRRAMAGESVGRRLAGPLEFWLMFPTQKPVRVHRNPLMGQCWHTWSQWTSRYTS